MRDDGFETYEPQNDGEGIDNGDENDGYRDNSDRYSDDREDREELDNKGNGHNDSSEDDSDPDSGSTMDSPVNTTPYQNTLNSNNVAGNGSASHNPTVSSSVNVIHRLFPPVNGKRKAGESMEKPKNKKRKRAHNHAFESKKRLGNQCSNRAAS